MNFTSSQTVLSTPAIQEVLSATVAHATKLNILVVVAILDSNGGLIGFVRMQGAQHGSVDVAMDKAWTSAAFGRDTGGAPARLAALPAATREGILRRPRFTDLRGGLPVRFGGVLVGGIGVSGGTDAQDEICAAAGITAIGADAIG